MQLSACNRLRGTEGKEALAVIKASDVMGAVA